MKLARTMILVSMARGIFEGSTVRSYGRGSRWERTLGHSLGPKAMSAALDEIGVPAIRRTVGEMEYHFWMIYSSGQHSSYR